MPVNQETEIISEREPTGVEGLDALVEGGFPYKSLIVLGGRPGSGKTILASQYLYYGAKRGEPATYVSFAESEEQYLHNMEKFGLDFRPLIEAGTFQFLDLSAVVSDAISDVLSLLTQQIAAFKTRRLVIDSFTAIGQAFDKIVDARIAIHTILGKLVREEGCTTLLLVEMPFGTDKIGLGVEEFVADGIIVLDLANHRRGSARTLTIKKMRGTKINISPTTYEINPRSGIIVFPKIEPKFEKGVSSRRLKTGIPGLDELIQGGILERSTTLLVGAAGTGKTTFGIQFLYNGAKDYGERGLLVSFGEPKDQFRTVSVESFGMSRMEEFEQAGTLTIESFLPESSSIESHLARFEKLLNNTKATRVIIDDITGLHSILSDDDFYFSLKRMAQIAKSKNATVIFTLTSSELSGAKISGIGVSTTMDNIIMLRYVELEGKMERSLILLKMRGTKHDNLIRKFTIGNGGLSIISTFEGYSGILSGNASRVTELYLKKEKETEEQERIASLARRQEFEERERQIALDQKSKREERKGKFEEQIRNTNSIDNN